MNESEEIIEAKVENAESVGLFVAKAVDEGYSGMMRKIEFLEAIAGWARTKENEGK